MSVSWQLERLVVYFTVTASVLSSSCLLGHHFWVIPPQRKGINTLWSLFNSTGGHGRMGAGVHFIRLWSVTLCSLMSQNNLELPEFKILLFSGSDWQFCVQRHQRRFILWMREWQFVRNWAGCWWPFQKLLRVWVVFSHLCSVLLDEGVPCSSLLIRESRYMLLLITLLMITLN